MARQASGLESTALRFLSGVVNRSSNRVRGATHCGANRLSPLVHDEYVKMRKHGRFLSTPATIEVTFFQLSSGELILPL